MGFTVDKITEMNNEKPVPEHSLNGEIRAHIAMLTETANQLKGF